MDFASIAFQLINTLINAIVQIVGHVAWPVVVLIIFSSLRKQGFNTSALVEVIRFLRKDRPTEHR